jgi:glycosyl transferase family 87
MARKLLTGVAWLFPILLLATVFRARLGGPALDFMQFYFGGRLAAAGRADEIYRPRSYDSLVAEMRAQGEGISSIPGGYCFKRPAFAAFLYVPLSWLPYRVAALAWLCTNLAIVVLLVWKLPLWFPFEEYFDRNLLGALLLMFAPFLAALAQGQDTVFLTLLAAFGIHAALQGRDIEAGVALAACSFKPHLVFLLPLVALASRRFKLLGWLTGAGFVLALGTFAVVGPGGAREWIELVGPSAHFMPQGMGNVRALGLQLGLPAGIAAGLFVTVCFGLIVRRGTMRERFSAAILASLLLSPYTYKYDLSLMVVAALLAGRPAWRYLLLLPWLIFYPRPDLLPVILLSVAYLGAIAVEVIWRGGEEPTTSLRDLSPDLAARVRMRPGAFWSRLS